jgi:hypothetical protein
MIVKLHQFSTSLYFPYASILRSKLRVIRATDEFESLLFPPTWTPAEVSLPDQPADAPVVAPTPDVIPAEPEPDVTVPGGMLTSPWRHQKTAFRFCLDHFAAGLRGILLAMGMGCIEGDAELIINRRGCARRITLREFHRKFHGGETKRRRWQQLATRTRSMIDGELRLNDVLDVVAQGIKPVVRVTLASGRSLRVTADHEIGCLEGRWVPAEALKPGDVVLTNGIPACKSCGGIHRVTTYKYAKHVGICRSCIGRFRRVKGKCIDKDGYIRLYGMKPHPRANKAGQVYEHIVVMERALGREITASEHVHHKNHIRHDNRPENLEVLPALQHYIHHGKHGGYIHLEGGKVQFVPKPDPVILVEPDGETDVYDLKMAGPGNNFVANGIIVHNCGKSLVACMLLLGLAARRVLICCPLRVVPVWVTQFERHVGVPVVIVPLDEDAGSVARKTELAASKLKLAQASGVPFIAVINYDSAWREPFAGWAEKVNWDLVIADEAHRLKAPGGKASLFFKRLRLRTNHRVALTGTPMPHGPMDVYAVFRFLEVSIFGPSFSAFRQKYAVMGGYGRGSMSTYTPPSAGAA